MARRKYNHIKKILREVKIPERSILPGMVLRFEYTKKGIFDVRPVILIIDVKGDNIDGINLNYLNEYQVQRMFSVAQSLIPVIEENLLKLPVPYIRLQLSTSRRVSSISGKNIYDRIKSGKQWIAAFRTYSFKVMTSPKVVNYKLDVMMGETKVGQKTTAETIRRKKKVEKDKGIIGEDQL